jgi:hypothetical protein
MLVPGVSLALVPKTYCDPEIVSMIIPLFMTSSRFFLFGGSCRGDVVTDVPSLNVGLLVTSPVMDLFDLSYVHLLRMGRLLFSFKEVEDDGLNMSKRDFVPVLEGTVVSGNDDDDSVSCCLEGEDENMSRREFVPVFEGTDACDDDGGISFTGGGAEPIPKSDMVPLAGAAGSDVIAAASRRCLSASS